MRIYVYVPSIGAHPLLGETFQDESLTYYEEDNGSLSIRSWADTIHFKEIARFRATQWSYVRGTE